MKNDDKLHVKIHNYLEFYDSEYPNMVLCLEDNCLNQLGAMLVTPVVCEITMKENKNE